MEVSTGGHSQQEPLPTPQLPLHSPSTVLANPLRCSPSVSITEGKGAGSCASKAHLWWGPEHATCLCVQWTWTRQSRCSSWRHRLAGYGPSTGNRGNWRLSLLLSQSHDCILEKQLSGGMEPSLKDSISSQGHLPPTEGSMR